MEVAIFRKARNDPTNRTLIGIWEGKSIKQVIREVKGAGVLSSGEYVAFKVVKGGYEIDGVSVAKSGTPFKH